MNDMSKLPHTIKGTVATLDDKIVELVLENGETVKVPRHILSDKIAINSPVHLAVFSDEDYKLEHERLAKVVLNELLKKA
jgi:hypothetical protein